MKLSDMVISALIKRGVLWEARAIEAFVELPGVQKPVTVKIEQMSIKFEKDDKVEA